MEHVTKPMTRTLDLSSNVGEVIAVELPVEWLSTQHPNASLFECSHFVWIVGENPNPLDSVLASVEG